MRTDKLSKTNVILYAWGLIPVIFEHNLMLNGINEYRNMLLEQELPTDDVDDLLLKVLDAPLQKRRRFEREDR